MATNLTEPSADPYKVNFNVWQTKTSTHLKGGPSSHRGALDSLEAAREMLTKHNNNLAVALKASDKKQAEHHQDHISKLQGVHDGILSGLAKAGYMHAKAARRQAFNKQSITESQTLSGPKPGVGIWVGRGSAQDHPGYQQGINAAKKIEDDFETEHLKLSAIKAHEKHVHLALHHEDKLREMLKSHADSHPRVKALHQKVNEHKDTADLFHAFARGLNRYQTDN